MIASAEPAAAIRRSEERFDLVLVEVGDERALVALGWDLDHTRDRLGVLGVAQRGVAVERVDRCQASIPRAGSIASLILEVVEESADQRRVQVAEVKLAGLLAGLALREAQQQPQRVAVGGHGARAGVSLGDEPVYEKRLERRGERAHDQPSSIPSSRCATSASSSGAACRYQ